MPGNLLLRPSKRKIFLLILTCLGFTAIGVAMILDGEGLDGWIVTLVFGAGLAVALAQLWPGATYLKLTPRGFMYCSLFRPQPFIPWEAVSEFRVSKNGSRTWVVFNHYATDHPRLAAVNRRLVGTTDALPDTYGRKPLELAELMNTWRTRALAR